MKGNIYPKASAPASAVALRMANERAERWRVRCEEARAEVAELRARLED